ncbi:hypothetical protein [Enterococcus sp. AZ109]|uniref:hypothetical protein n=1 Tax=Enterococcus sp. AZ109 TaxID=2774634 RepID=UPI003F22510E
MEPIEVFLQFSESVLKITILKTFYYKGVVSLQDFRQIYSCAPCKSTEYLWELCNEGLIQKRASVFSTEYQLTNLGKKYVAVLEELELWLEKKALYGGIYQ